MPANCKGGIEDFICSEGHIGALCEACDLEAFRWPDRYSRLTKAL